MPRDGNGNFTLAQPAFVAGTTILSATVNSDLSDIGTALTASIANDGQTTIAANLPMAGFKHTGVGVATARNQYATLSQVQDGSADWRGVATGTGDAITFTTSPATTVYTAGETDVFLVSAANTGAVTINKNGLGAKNLYTGSGVALPAGLLQTGMTVTTRYDGTQFRIMSLGGTSLGEQVLAATSAANAQSALGVPAIPTVAAGAGNFIVVAPGFGVAYSLPAGGTWAYFYTAFLNTGANVFAQAAATAAGGTLIAAPGGATTILGFAWRIA